MFGQRRENEEQSEGEGKTPSIQTHQTDRFIFCVVCRVEDNPQNMVTPCVCRDARYWHYECLVRWIMQCRDQPCQICWHSYTDYRIRRENRNSRLDYFLDQPGHHLSNLSLSGLLFIGFCLNLYYKFQNVWNSLSINDSFSEIFALVFFQYSIPLFLMFPFLVLIRYFVLSLNYAYQEWSRFRAVIYFDDFNGEQQQIGSTHRYELGEALRQQEIEQQLLAAQDDNQDLLEDEDQDLEPIECPK